MATATRVVERDECDLSFTQEVEKLAGTDIFACYQCGVCTGGCPVSFLMDYPPRQIIRMVQMGMRDKVLSSTTIWLCSSCNTCFTRCPREVELPEVMASIKSVAIKQKFPGRIIEGPALYKSMVDNMKKYGRIHETELYVTFARKTGLTKLLKQMPLAINLFKKRKIKMLPDKIKARDQLKALIEASKKLEKAIE
ncbi:MAG: 4Fe-4S dicluster domain-containing protein [Candidatus Bathyarchaeia archaeon]